MTLLEYKTKLKLPLRQTTLSFLIKNNKILLAMKKRGFGKSKWNGVGGKPRLGETIEETAIREMEEEIGVSAQSLILVASLTFFYPFEKDADQVVSVFFVKKWTGKPEETEEMMPHWFSFKKLPFDIMWPDDSYWLPKVLDGKFVTADFIFDEKQRIVEYTLTSNLVE